MKTNSEQSDTVALEDLLSEIFREDIHVESYEQEKLDGATLSIAEIEYERRIDGQEGPARREKIRQTVLVSSDVALNLPEFNLRPTPIGFMAGISSLLGGNSNIHFDESPEFSAAYHLHGWAENSVRLLFNQSLRDYFTARREWNVIGKGQALVIFHHKEVVDLARREQFRRDGLAILSHFQRAEEELDAIGSVRRETTASDMSATANRMGGVVGGMLTRQLKKLHFSRGEMEHFASQPCPRDIPAGMNKQVFGDTFILYLLGLMFLVIGLVLGLILVFIPNEGVPGLVYLIPITQPLIGLLILFFTWKFRNRKKRTLQYGSIVEAYVVDIEASNLTVNGQRGFNVKVEYVDGGKTVIKTFSAHGGSVDQARKRNSEGKPVRVLIDPVDERHAIGLDLLLVFDDDL